MLSVNPVKMQSPTIKQIGTDSFRYLGARLINPLAIKMLTEREPPSLTQISKPKSVIPLDISNKDNESVRKYANSLPTQESILSYIVELEKNAKAALERQEKINKLYSDKIVKEIEEMVLKIKSELPLPKDRFQEYPFLSFVNEHNLQLHLIVDSAKEGDRILLSPPSRVYDPDWVKDDSPYRDNILQAAEIIQYVQEHVLFSFNYASRSIPIKSLLTENESLPLSAIDSATSLIRNQAKITDLHGRAVKAKYYRVGNCHEMACVALRASQGYLVTADLLSVRDKNYPGANHAVVLLTDSKSTVFCDPWAGICYPLEKLQQYLCCQIGIVCNAKKDWLLPIVRKFDPETQQLEFLSIGFFHLSRHQSITKNATHVAIFGPFLA